MSVVNLGTYTLHYMIRSCWVSKFKGLLDWEVMRNKSGRGLASLISRSDTVSVYIVVVENCPLSRFLLTWGCKKSHSLHIHSPLHIAQSLSTDTFLMQVKSRFLLKANSFPVFVPMSSDLEI